METEKKYTLEEIDEIFSKMDRVGQYFGLKIEAAEKDYGRASIPLDDRHLNSLHTAHGAAIFLVADLAFGAACAGLNLYCVNAQTSLSYVNPGLVGPLTAEARLIKGGRRLMVYDMVVTGGDGTIVAKGTITGYVRASLDKLFADYAAAEAAK